MQTVIHSPAAQSHSLSFPSDSFASFSFSLFCLSLNILRSSLYLKAFIRDKLPFTPLHRLVTTYHPHYCVASLFFDSPRKFTNKHGTTKVKMNDNRELEGYKRLTSAQSTVLKDTFDEIELLMDHGERKDWLSWTKDVTENQIPDEPMDTLAGSAVKYSSDPLSFIFLRIVYGREKMMRHDVAGRIIALYKEYLPQLNIETNIYPCLDLEGVRQQRGMPSKMSIYEPSS